MFILNPVVLFLITFLFPIFIFNLLLRHIFPNSSIHCPWTLHSINSQNNTSSLNFPISLFNYFIHIMVKKPWRHYIFLSQNHFHYKQINHLSLHSEYCSYTPILFTYKPLTVSTNLPYTLYISLLSST